MSNETIWTRKIKTGYYYDLYQCSECGKNWKSTANKIGHKEAACKKNR